MKITEGSEIANRVDIISPKGKKLSKIKSFDTITKEAEIYVILSDGTVAINCELKVATAKVKLIGCKAIDRKTKGEIL
jgi:hypothetical protein